MNYLDTESSIRSIRKSILQEQIHMAQSFDQYVDKHSKLVCAPSVATTFMPEVLDEADFHGNPQSV
jgi:hypothetical protein